MKFSFNAVNSGSKSATIASPTVCITEATWTRSETHGIGQAQITLRGVDLPKGPITIKVRGKEYKLDLDDTHSIWFVHQKEEAAQKAWIDLWNTLAEVTPVKVTRRNKSSMDRVLKLG